MAYREPRALMLPVGAIAYARHHRNDIVGQVVVIRVLYGRFFGGWRCIRGLRYRSPTAKSRRDSASGVTSFGRPFQRRHYRARCGGFITDEDAMTCEACEAETQARHIARGKQSATPGIHHPHLPASA